MFDTLPNLVDRVLQLLEYRNRKKQAEFKTLIQPIFDELQLIHQDYLKMFTEVKSIISSDINFFSDEELINSLKKTSDYLISQRIKLRGARTKVNSISTEILNQRLCDHQTIDFLHEVTEYLGPKWFLNHGSAALYLLDVIEEKISSSNFDRNKLSTIHQDLIELIEDLIKTQEENWESICRRYTPLIVRASKLS